MVQFRFCLVLAALCASSLGDTVKPPPDTIILPVPLITKPAQETAVPQPPEIPEIPKPEPIIEKTTKPPTTTPPTTTSTTTAPTTTVPTTTVPTTTVPTTTVPTTTVPTTTAPSPAPTPAPPAPSPPGPPEQGSWKYNDEHNVTCIVVQFAAQLNVSYTKNITENETATVYKSLNVPVNASVVAGNCTGNVQLIVIAWPQNTTDNLLKLTYLKNETTKSYSLKAVDVILSADNFVNASSNASVELHHGAEWSTPLATSYRCMSSTRLNMTSNTSAADITFSKLQEEAFRTGSEAGFSAPRDCGGGDVPDAVPIAVGCALGGLVVVVLVAYLVGRRRSARGYLSM